MGKQSGLSCPGDATHFWKLWKRWYQVEPKRGTCSPQAGRRAHGRLEPVRGEDTPGHPHGRAREGALLTAAEVYPLPLGLPIEAEGARGAGKPHGPFRPSPETRDQINTTVQEGRVPGSQGDGGPLQSVLLFPQDRPSAAPGTQPASVLLRPEPAVLQKQNLMGTHSSPQRKPSTVSRLSVKPMLKFSLCTLVPD